MVESKMNNDCVKDNSHCALGRNRNSSVMNKFVIELIMPSLKTNNKFHFEKKK